MSKRQFNKESLMPTIPNNEFRKAVFISAANAALVGAGIMARNAGAPAGDILLGAGLVLNTFIFGKTSGEVYKVLTLPDELDGEPLPRGIRERLAIKHVLLGAIKMFGGAFAYMGLQQGYEPPVIPNPDIVV